MNYDERNLETTLRVCTVVPFICSSMALHEHIIIATHKYDLNTKFAHTSNGEKVCIFVVLCMPTTVFTEYS